MDPRGVDTNGNDGRSKGGRAVSPIVDASTLRLADRYWLEEPIGEGSTCTVWRAWDELLARTVAVKVLRPSADLRTEVRSELRNKMAQVARLSHPGLVAVHDLAGATGPDGGDVTFVVMELLEGETLAARLRRGPLPWREASRICAAIASALAALHEAGTSHRDVRPGRIFLSDGGAKLLGFGLDLGLGLPRPAPRTPLTGSASSGPGAVSPARPARAAYEAPERRARRRGSPADLAAADVYSLGAVFAEMLTGHPADLDALPREVPGDVAALCLRCVAHDRSARPSAAEVGDVLKAAPARARRAARGRSFARPLTRWAGLASFHRSASARFRAPRVGGGPERPRIVRTRRGVVIGLAAALAGGLVITVAAVDSPPESPLIGSLQPEVTAPAMSWLTEDPSPSPEPSSGASEPGEDASRASRAPDPARTAPAGSGPTISEPAPSGDPNRPPAPAVPPTWPRPDQPPGREQTLSTLAALRNAVHQGVSDREIRSDVGLDLDNVITNLWNDVTAGRVTDPRPRAREIRDKIFTRLRERGLTRRQADRLTAILSGITGSGAAEWPPGDGDRWGRDGYRHRDYYWPYDWPYDVTPSRSWPGADRDRHHRRRNYWD